MKFDRLYAPHPGDPYRGIEFQRVACEIREPDGSVVFHQDDVEVPVAWSQTAADILAQKYFRKAGVPTALRYVQEKDVPGWLCRRITSDGAMSVGETSARQVFDRMAGCWTYWGWRLGYFSSEDDASTFYDELRAMLALQVAAPNSPQWFNSGLHWAYGIDGPAQGHWYVDQATGEARPSTSAYEHPQPHACFIMPVADDLVNEGGIMDLWVREARIFKYGSGTGTNFSNLRGVGERLSGGGISSGIMSFLKIGDCAAGSIKSAGTTRRAAKMVILDVDHPEIEDFIAWKVREEKKVKALIAGSDEYSADWRGEAYQTVSGQNSNNSVRVTDEFMRAVEQDADWNLTARTTGEVLRTMKARDLWRKIAEAAWASADPGVQFHDTVNSWHTCPASGAIRATNPCGEFNFLDNTACNLASLNLMKFRTPTKEFDVHVFTHAVRLWTVVLDISVSMAQYPSWEIAETNNRFRTLGLGYANLGALLMSRGLPYDSDEGRGLAASITALMTGYAYRTSAEMAGELGEFPAWSKNTEPMAQVIHKHWDAAQKLNAVSIINDHVRKTWSEVGMSDHGFRNAQVSVIAPTGTIALVMDCDTTGVEPDFALVKKKKLAGGGTMTLVNKTIQEGLLALGYSKNNVDMMALNLSMGRRNPDFLRQEHLSVFHCAGQISLLGHLLMVAAVQPFVSGAISKTVNLPSSATIEDCAETYMAAWRLGLKAVALYRDGSKLSQPLEATAPTKPAQDEYPIVTIKPVPDAVGHVLDGRYISVREEVVPSDQQSDRTPETPPRGPLVRSAGRDREKMPPKRRGYTQKASVGGHKIYLRTGEYADGRLGEIFVDMHKDGATMRSIMNCFAVAVSIGLQYGVPLEEFVDAFTFTRFEPAGPVQGHDGIRNATSLVDFMFRDLAASYLGRGDLVHVKEEAAGEAVTKLAEAGSEVRRVKAFTSTTGEACRECGNFDLIRSGTCLVCLNCGTTSGCS